jgi:hypothetical protein
VLALEPRAPAGAGFGLVPAVAGWHHSVPKEVRIKLFVPLVAAALVAAVLASASAAAPSPPGGTLSASPTSIDFGTITSGETAVRTVTITNTGMAPVRVWQWGVEGFWPGGFYEDQAICPFKYTPLGALLAPGKSCTWPLVVVADEANPGTFTGAFVLRGAQGVELISVPLTVTVVH